MSLARLLRVTGRARGPALQAAELVGRAEPALQAGRHDHERRRLRCRLVRRSGDARACSAAPNRPGTTATCASSSPSRARAGCSHTSGPRPAPRCSRPTATRSATGSWLWMHNGVLAGFPAVKRDLAMAVDPALFPEIEGSTDSEMLFFLALTFGLADDPPDRGRPGRRPGRGGGPAARRRAPGPDDGGHHRRRDDVGVPLLQRRTVPLAVPQYRHLDAAPPVPGQPGCCTSCPTTPGWWCPSRWATCSGAWREVPEATCLVVHGGGEEMRPFAPTAP